jgi:hypothetical protein
VDLEIYIFYIRQMEVVSIMPCGRSPHYQLAGLVHIQAGCFGQDTMSNIKKWFLGCPIQGLITIMTEPTWLVRVYMTT